MINQIRRWNNRVLHIEIIRKCNRSLENLRLRWVLIRRRLILPRNLDQDLTKSETESLVLNQNQSQNPETMESNREAYQAQTVLTRVTPRATPSQKAEAIQEVTEILPELTKQGRVLHWDLRNHQEVHNSSMIRST